MFKPKVIAIVGPTASGKTSLSLVLAERFSGEIISADSRQVYRGLDIGTAKVTPEERGPIPHHLIDVVDIETIFTAHDFATQATTAIADINTRSRTPIIVGGTFFYLDQLRGTSGKAPVPPNPNLRAELATLTLKELADRVAAFDPSLLKTIDTTNPRRLMRAVEILEALGHIPVVTTTPSPYRWLTIGLKMDKDILRTRYAERAKQWLVDGFQSEIQGLLESGVTRDRLSEIGFEYRLGLELLDNTIDEATFIQRFVEKNWQYAKRQYLWLKRDGTVTWFDPSEQAQIFSTVERFLKD